MESTKQNVKEISEISKRFLNILTEKGLTGYYLTKNKILPAESTLTKIKNGQQEPSKKTIQKLCDKYPKINASWIITGIGEKYNIGISGEPLETYGLGSIYDIKYVDNAASASFIETLYGEEKNIETTPVVLTSKEISKKDRLYVFDVVGDCMNPTLRNNSKILAEIIDESQWEYVNGIVVVVEGKEEIVKRVYSNKLFNENKLILTPDNPSFPRKEVARCDIRGIWKVLRIISQEVN